MKSETIKLIEENIKKIFMSSESAMIFEKSQKSLRNQKLRKAPIIKKRDWQIGLH